jgi:hypothetical protein
MKALTIILLAVLPVFFSSCKQAASVDPITNIAPSFNQVNIAFEASQSQCLLNQWYGKTYKNEPIVFRVINDANTYAAFFPCTLTTSLPTVDFTKNYMFIGMKADYNEFINSPVNISQITQVLTPTNGGNYTLQVKVVGETAKNSQGGEWFAFTSVVPKITGTVSLDMQYQFK